MLSSAPEIMAKLDSLLTRAGELLGEDNRKQVSDALQNVEQLTSALAGSSETLAALPRDIQATVGDLRGMLVQAQPDLTAALANINRSSENLASLTARIDEMLQQNQSDLGRFVQEGLGEAPALLRESRAALRDLEKLVAELQRDPSQLIHRAPSDALEMDP